jgi:uncharacterized protein (TIGR02996 family)
MNEEAGFIQALLAAPDDRTTLLVYADWLEERDPGPAGRADNSPAAGPGSAAARAAYLRKLATEPGWPPRDPNVDLGWVMLLRGRQFGPGSRMKWNAEPPEGLFDFASITADRHGTTVRLTIRRRSRGLDFGWWELEVGTR